MTTVQQTAGQQSEPRSEPRRRLRLPRVRWDLLDCSLQGHRTVGRDVARVRREDALVLREDADGLRWHRCLRCDAWLPSVGPTAAQATREHLPPREQIRLPLRGRPLRDRYVLRLIALDRVVHVLGLGILAAAVLVFSGHRGTLDRWWTWGLDFVQQHGVVIDTTHGFLAQVSGWFSTPSSHLLFIGLGLVAYAALEATEAVGLWLGRRWAEYLTFVATSILMVPEVADLASGVSATGVALFALNLAVVVYLLLAKRLFGLRGGGRAEAAEREADSGWSALERTAPPSATQPA
ncbi:DUF2127 domain-containing protein [Quadrisphaera setariae]|uniref:DUF2127 domain-containing protein n=1 Tax=Quadrisphaera setariae TaxID=2593304 RepID=UPI001C9C38DF|nr:DUF2127 domain-containing protein [Quadrisphaera setariae]